MQRHEMRIIKIVLLALMLIGLGISGASADIVLFDWAFNVSGVTYEHLPTVADNSFSILPDSYLVTLPLISQPALEE